MSMMHHKLFVDSGGVDTPVRDGGALAGLAAIDADVANVLERYGPPPDRSLPASYETLARAIVGQQVSRAAASAIWNKMEANGVCEAAVIAGKTPEEMMHAGLSRRKAEYLIGIAAQITSGALDLDALAKMDGDAIAARLVEIRGIGSWTADNYRLFALADMDAWPINDIALQEGMKLIKSLETRPTAKQLAELGEPWRPYRGAGALVLWHVYGILVRKVTVADI